VVDACAPGNGKLRAGITVQGGVAVQRTFASAMIHATCVWQRHPVIKFRVYGLGGGGFVTGDVKEVVGQEEAVR
jgi:hypothetical protein